MHHKTRGGHVMGGGSGRGRKKSRKNTGDSSCTGPAADEAQAEELEAGKEQLGERLHQLSLFGEVSADAGTSELLESMLSRCMSLFACKSGSIFLFKPDSDELELAVAKGPMCDALAGIRQRIGVGVAGAVAERQEGIFAEDIEKSEEFSKRDSGRYETNSFASVPIVCRGELLGVLNLRDKE